MEHTFQLTADRSIVREAVKGIIWTIFFHRLFGPISPLVHNFLDVPYPMANLPELDELIDEKVNQLIKVLDSNASHNGSGKAMSSSSSTPFGSPSNRVYNIESGGSTANTSPAILPVSENINAKYGQIIIQFFEKSVIKKSTWFGKNEDVKLWESWIINVTCLPTSMAPTPTLAAANTSPNVNHANSAIDLTVSQFEDILYKIIEIVDTNKDHIPPITTLDSSPFPYSITIPTTGDATWTKYLMRG